MIHTYISPVVGSRAAVSLPSFTYAVRIRRRGHAAYVWAGRQVFRRPGQFVAWPISLSNLDRSPSRTCVVRNVCMMYVALPFAFASPNPRSRSRRRGHTTALPRRPSSRSLFQSQLLLFFTLARHSRTQQYCSLATPVSRLPWARLGL